MEVFLAPSGHAYVSVLLQGTDEEIQIDCMIDTGFSGGISIPSDLEDEFDYPVISEVAFQIANGDIMEVEVFLGEIIEEGKKRDIAAIFTDGTEGLVGIEFLRGKKFLLDLVEEQVELL